MCLSAQGQVDYFIRFNVVKVKTLTPGGLGPRGARAVCGAAVLSEFGRISRECLTHEQINPFLGGLYFGEIVQSE